MSISLTLYCLLLLLVYVLLAHFDFEFFCNHARGANRKLW